MKEIMKCNHHVERVDNLGFTSYDDCGKLAKFKAIYDSPNVNESKKIKYNVCGIHKNSLISWAKRYKKMVGREVKINFEELK